MLSNEFSKNIFWVYSIIIKNKNLNAIKLSKDLKKKGIETRPFFYPMHMQPIIKKLKLIDKNEKFPVSEKIYRYGLYLPSGIGNTFNEVKEVVKQLKIIFKN